MRPPRGALVLLTVVLCAADSFASPVIRRFALAVGANNGDRDRPRLAYAVSDAESFARVMQTLGGVQPADLVVLTQPRRSELEDALDTLRRRVASAQTAPAGSVPGRTEVVVYFSGHADESGLLLGGETFPYRGLRGWMDSVQADLRIAIVDACASGALTRRKGSRRTKPFLVNAASSMRGHVFLTSSAADEAAQESARIGGSFFTHYLVSGLRGAADVSGEGAVTLNEAYQFAFHETLGRTVKTRIGAQHPSYDINLSGSGEVVMTDVRQTSTSLVLSEDLSGRFFVWNSRNRLEVELFKPSGRRVELGLEPGRYRVRNAVESGASVSAFTLDGEGRLVLGLRDFSPATPEPAVARGLDGAASRFGPLSGQWLLGARLGRWQSDGLGSPDSDYVYDPSDTTGAATLSHWLTQRWSLELTAWTTMSLVQSEHLTPDDAYVAAVLLGARRNFRSFAGLGPSVRPFLSAAVGPYFRHARSSLGEQIASVAAGGVLGAGVDFQLARGCLLETRLGYGFTTDFTDDTTGTFGVRSSYQGFELAVGLSAVFGAGRVPDR